MTWTFSHWLLLLVLAKGIVFFFIVSGCLIIVYYQWFFLGWSIHLFRVWALWHGYLKRIVVSSSPRVLSIATAIAMILSQHLCLVIAQNRARHLYLVTIRFPAFVTFLLKILAWAFLIPMCDIVLNYRHLLLLRYLFCLRSILSFPLTWFVCFIGSIKVVYLRLVDAVVLIFVYCRLVLGAQVLSQIFLRLIIILVATLLHLMQATLLLIIIRLIKSTCCLDDWSLEIIWQLRVLSRVTLSTTNFAVLHSFFMLRQ